MKPFQEPFKEKKEQVVLKTQVSESPIQLNLIIVVLQQQKLRKKILRFLASIFLPVWSTRNWEPKITRTKTKGASSQEIYTMNIDNNHDNFSPILFSVKTLKTSILPNKASLKSPPFSATTVRATGQYYSPHFFAHVRNAIEKENLLFWPSFFWKAAQASRSNAHPLHAISTNNGTRNSPKIDV